MWRRPDVPQEIPPFATLHAMAYDVTRGRTILVGNYVYPQTGPIPTYVYAPMQLAPMEACTASIDGDDDGKVGCADDDCWHVCKPYCVPGAAGRHLPERAELRRRRVRSD